MANDDDSQDPNSYDGVTCPVCHRDACPTCGACHECPGGEWSDDGIERLLQAVFGRRVRVLSEAELRQLSQGDLARLRIFGKVH